MTHMAIIEPWWATEFRPYTTQHVLVLIVVGVLVAGALTLGLRWRDRAPHRERLMRRLWAWAVIPTQLWHTIYWLLPDQFDIADSLPLHVCDLIVWIVPVALLTSLRWSHALLYYVGIGLSILGFATPVLREGHTNWYFWLFWISHTQIVASALYLCVVMRFRPSWRDLLTTMTIFFAYVAIILPTNIIFSLHYGYIGNVPQPSYITKLGVWPYRLLAMTAIMFVAYVILWAPWAILSGRAHQPTERRRVDVPAGDDHPDT
ncbi:MAG: TIGR02206 family membrane protein [Phycisphaerales bacterium JB043]